MTAKRYRFNPSIGRMPVPARAPRGIVLSGAMNKFDNKQAVMPIKKQTSKQAQ